MTLIFQIPRHCLTWLLIAQAFLIAPHFSHIPIWILFAWVIIVAWRVQVYRGHWSFPGRWVKFVLVSLCVAALMFEYRRWYGLEPMVGLLVVAFLLKLLEMHQQRDALTVIYIGYFVAATNFLFSQTLEMTAYIFLTVTLLTTALIALNQSEQEKRYWHSLSLSAKILLQSLPLTLILFLMIPRIGSLWAVPQQQQAAKTGVSDTMSPGDFSRLSRSDDVAFQVTFAGEIPPQNQLYWRGLVFSEFDGRTWGASTLMGFDGGPIDWFSREPLPWRDRIEVVEPGLDYDIIIEPTQQLWLYALATPVTSERFIGLTREFNLIRRMPVGSRMRYRVTSYLQHSTEANGLPNWMIRRETQLPQTSNPRSREQAHLWWQETGEPRAYMAKVLANFTQSFTYTLQPPLLGINPVDEFLWSTQRGFCEHFASAFVFMMRAAGIPARVVAGYQGGEINRLENFLIVKQSDAHAWAEVWFEGEGWVRVDPTAAVAPQRIESGLSGALNQEEAQLLDRSFLTSFNHIVLMNRLRLQLEVLNYKWSTMVVSYDSEAQAGLLRRWLGDNSAWRIGLAFLSATAIVVALLAAWLFFSSHNFSQNRGDRLYQQFLRTLKKRGVEKLPGEGPRTFAQRAARKLPKLEAWIARVSHYYEQYRYGDDPAALRYLNTELKAGPR